VTTGRSLLLALAAFVLIATANSGGYRYGVSDQAFYVPAVALAQAPSLFPRDRALFEPQMRRWAGDELLAGLSRLTFGNLPVLFGALYVLTLVTLALGGIALARSLGYSWWAIATFLILLTLRHRIARTGANSLEGYFHPRVLSFAVGLFALAAVVRLRLLTATLWTAAAALVHTTTAVWFGGVVAVAALWPWRRSTRLWMGVLALVVAAIWITARVAPDVFQMMDVTWLHVLKDKDYLFASAWPAYAWVTNLAYPIVILVLYGLRARRGSTAPGEAPLVAGLMGLVGVFLLSVPLTDVYLAIAVQMQVNRVFWVLDAVTALYIAWWISDGVPALRRPAVRHAVVAALLLLAIGRGFYIIRVETDRSLAAFTLPANGWTDAMRWIERQPASTSWHVLADANHGWRYGSTVRVAARRDTLIEVSKDSALALYDRRLAPRVLDRLAAVGPWEELTLPDVRALDGRFGLDVMVDEADRAWPLPVLYRNAQFVVYDLR